MSNDNSNTGRKQEPSKQAQEESVYAFPCETKAQVIRNDASQLYADEERQPPVQIGNWDFEKEAFVNPWPERVGLGVVLGVVGVAIWWLLR